MRLFLSCSFLFLFFLSSFYSMAKGQEFIYKTCKTFSKQDPNINYGFCTTSLQAAPASRCATLQGLGKISFRLLLNNVTDTRCHVRHLMKNKKLDPFVKMCLEDCVQLYSDAIPSIKQATKDYKAKRFNDANIKISSVMDSAATCEDGFKEKSDVVSPLTKKNGDTFELSAIVLSIIPTTE